MACIFRIEPGSLTVIGVGPVDVALGFVSVAAVVIRRRIFRIEPDRLVEVGDSAVKIAAGLVRNAAVVVGGPFFGSSRIASPKSAMARSMSPLAL